MRRLSVVSLLVVCGAADVPWLDTSAEAPERTPPAPDATGGPQFVQWPYLDPKFGEGKGAYWESSDDATAAAGGTPGWKSRRKQTR